MKILVAKLFIAVLVLGGSPNLSKANPTSNVVPTAICDPCGSWGVDGHSSNIHSIYIPAGHVHINISGTGRTDVDLFVSFNGSEVGRGVSRVDDETVCLNVSRGGFFTVKVKNLGHGSNQYRLWLS